MTWNGSYCVVNQTLFGVNITQTWGGQNFVQLAQQEVRKHRHAVQHQNSMHPMNSMMVEAACCVAGTQMSVLPAVLHRCHCIASDRGSLQGALCLRR